MSILEGSYNRYLFQWPLFFADLRRFCDRPINSYICILRVDTQPHLKTTFFRSLMDSTKKCTRTHYGDTAGTKKSARDLGTVQWLPADLSLLPIIQQELA